METGLLLLVAGTAMIMDLRWMRVDNGWIVVSLLAGLLFQLWSQGIYGLGCFAAGVFFPWIVLIVLFYFRMLGPGDIKLLCALGGIMGAEAVGKCMIYSFVLAAILSLFILIFYGDFRQRFQYFMDYLEDLFFMGRIRPYYKEEMTVENIHFTVPVFMSVLLYVGGVY